MSHQYSDHLDKEVLRKLNKKTIELEKKIDILEQGLEVLFQLGKMSPGLSKDLLNKWKNYKK